MMSNADGWPLLCSLLFDTAWEEQWSPEPAQQGQFVRDAVVSLVAVAMGLNLLEVLPLRLPSLDVDVRQLSAPPLLQVSDRTWFGC